jgi:hypothetical protein
MAKLSVDNQLFCIERLWDQRAEAGYMKKIEDEFQALVNEPEAGRVGPLSPGEHRSVTRFWGLWHWRNHFIDSPLEDIRMNGVGGQSLTLDQKVILESRWYAFAEGEGTLAAGVMTGLHIQIAIDHYEMADGGRRWSVLRSQNLPLVIGDRPGSLLSIPASPRLLLAADHSDGELTVSGAFQANQAALAFSRNFAVIGRAYALKGVNITSPPKILSR